MDGQNALNGVTVYTEQNIYDFDNQIMLHYYPRRILEFFDNPKELSLLDLGLGHGYSAIEFSGKFKEHTILEGNPEIIQQFKERYNSSGMHIIQTWFEEYEPDDKFDIIVIGFVLEHVDDPLQLLKKYRAFLKEGGSLFLASPNAETLNRRIGHAAGLLPDMLQLSEHDFLCGHKRYFTHHSLNELCRNAGLNVVKEEGLYLKPLTTRQMISLNLDQSILDALCIVGQNYPELSLGILMECKLK